MRRLCEHIAAHRTRLVVTVWSVIAVPVLGLAWLAGMALR